VQLDVEIEQTRELVQKKMDNAERLESIESDVKSMNKEFYCDICEKVSAPEVHPNYYPNPSSFPL
jgi:hypothetical protein